MGICITDLSTGSLSCTEIESEEELWNELSRLRPAELLIPEGWMQRHPQWKEQARNLITRSITPQPELMFELCEGDVVLSRRFGVTCWKALGLDELSLASAACLGLVRYIEHMFPAAAGALCPPQAYRLQHTLHLDRQTLSHLSIFEDAPSQHRLTLAGILDQTATPMEEGFSFSG